MHRGVYVLKVMLLLKRKPGLSLEEFIDHYEHVHVPLAAKYTAGLLHYERHYLHPGSYVLFGDEVKEPEYDVLTELWYEDRASFDRLQDLLRQHPHRVADIIADEDNLFDRPRCRLAFVDSHASDVSASSAKKLELQVRRLADKNDIVDLVHRYSYCIDHRKYDELVALFTEDCIVDYGPVVAPPVHGQTALRAMFGTPDGGFAATSHHNANVLVTFEGDDRASVLTSLYAWHLTPAGGTPRVWGYYHDVVVRTADGWRLAERQLRVAGHEDWPIEWHPSLGSSG
jgi:hypothetical protein